MLATTSASCARELADWPEAATLDAIGMARGLTARLGAAMAVGEDARKLVDANRNMGAAMLDMLGRSRRRPSYLPDAHRRRFCRHSEQLEKQLRADITARRRAGISRGRDVLDATLDFSATRPGLLDDHVVARIIMANLFGMRGSPAICLAWVLHLLATHPPVQEEVRAEVRAADGCADLDGLPVTRAVVKEALRLYPPSWLLTRTMARSAEIGGYRLRAGPVLLVSPYAIHRDARWFDRPTAFDPDRWLNTAPPAEPRAFLAFGSGPMACKGVSWVMTQTVIAAASVVRRWHLSADPSPYRLVACGDLRPVGLRLRLTSVAGSRAGAPNPPPG
ncbi:cytochrome P450 [Streptomyces sp. NPDC048483]|uniref:cytochrome P450 n=1 Tax=Streptomyces sp. NPDC048483 TaxID=3154927 RepID=UPI00343ACD88